MIVANNQWGISTPAAEQHSEKHVVDRAKPFGIKSALVDGNDTEVVYRELQKAMDYVRAERRPFLLEVMVSRLYGHSSASGANFVPDEVDCLVVFERRLEERKVLTRAAMGRASRAVHPGASRDQQAHSRGAPARGRLHLEARVRRARPRARGRRPRIGKGSLG